MGVVVMALKKKKVKLDDVIKAKEQEKKVIAKAKVEALRKIKDILRGHPDLAEELGIEV